MDAPIGPGFPFKYGQGGYFNVQKRSSLIKASLKQIFGTKRGERVRNPRFGSRIYLLEFEPNDDIFIALASFYAWEAASQELRIITDDIQIIPDTGVTGHEGRIVINFTEKETGIPDDFIYTVARGI